MKWRPIKTAPKDRHVLLRYPSFADPETDVVTQGCWIEHHHSSVVMELLERGLDPSKVTPVSGWRVAYVAILQHGGRWRGLAFEARSCWVEPTHWMPLPEVPIRKRS